MVGNKPIINVKDNPAKEDIIQDGQNKFTTAFVSTREKQIYKTDEEARASDEAINKEMLENVHSEVMLERSKKFQNK